MRNYFSQIFEPNKGIIYLQSCEFEEEFKTYLKEAYTSIEDAVEASFINWKNSKAKPVLITFNLQEQQYTIYIPGQPSDTVVYNIKIGPWYVISATHRYTQKQDADEKKFTEIAQRRPRMWQNK